jgi:hypothetical protein
LKKCPKGLITIIKPALTGQKNCLVERLFIMTVLIISISEISLSEKFVSVKAVLVTFEINTVPLLAIRWGH